MGSCGFLSACNQMLFRGEEPGHHSAHSGSQSGRGSDRPSLAQSEQLRVGAPKGVSCKVLLKPCCMQAQREGSLCFSVLTSITRFSS